MYKMQYEGISWLYPPGSIMSYIGTSDPSGWIICDGVVRTATDKRYDRLAVLLGGTNTGNSITPPDLRNRFLYSKTTDLLTKSGSSTFTLTNDHIPQHNHTIDITQTAHSHANTVVIAAHSHTIVIVEGNHTHADTINSTATHSHTANLYKTDNRDFNTKVGNGPAADSGVAPDPATFWTTEPETPTISVNNVIATGVFSASVTEYKNANALTLSKSDASTGITASSQNAGKTNPSSFSILPPYATVNYIIKY